MGSCELMHAELTEQIALEVECIIPPLIYEEKFEKMALCAWK